MRDRREAFFAACSLPHCMEAFVQFAPDGASTIAKAQGGALAWRLQCGYCDPSSIHHLRITGENHARQRSRQTALCRQRLPSLAAPARCTQPPSVAPTIDKQNSPAPSALRAICDEGAVVIELTEHDWSCLSLVDEGAEVRSSMAPAVARLGAMNFIVLRPRNTVVITGLGREALLRRKYSFGLPGEALLTKSSATSDF